ncbi:BC1872 family protein [Priestia flexa]|uniref:BC1872 family protein n=1 Tax=Priestia flexa TaxID=86664 RepID=UPI003F85D5E6
MKNWEIDVLIAGKVMGWECECHSEINTWSTFGEYGALVIGEDFAPSIDIRDAWLVVEKLKQEGFYSFHADLSLDSGQEWWSWHFSKGVNNYGSQQETAPLAICMAALKAFNIEEAVKS